MRCWGDLSFGNTAECGDIETREPREGTVCREVRTWRWCASLVLTPVYKTRRDAAQSVSTAAAASETPTSFKFYLHKFAKTAGRLLLPMDRRER